MLAVTGCAGSEPKVSVLAAEPEPTAAEKPTATPEAHATEGPVSLPFRGPAAGGTAYRLILEMSGEREVSLSTDHTPREPLDESHLLELEYRELQIEQSGGEPDAYLLALDALHYKLLQRNPAAQREVELADDRLRVMADGKEELDLRGSQPKESLTPRKLLDRVFAVVTHDSLGNPVSIRPQGVPVAKRFLRPFLVKSAIAYSRLPLPTEPITAGSTWSAERFPVSPAGGLGLSLTVEYTLAGFQELSGLPCAFILLRAEESGEDVPSKAGFTFDRVVAHLSGSAWVELGTSRLRRLVLEDEVRAAYTRGAEPAPVSRQRLRHRSRLLLEPRDADVKSSTWEDGSERFERH